MFFSYILLIISTIIGVTYSYQITNNIRYQNIIPKKSYLNINCRKHNHEDFEKINEIKLRLENLCCGEINETNEIEEYEKLEKEMLEVFQKMRKHNLKKIYNKSTDLYKLFKK